MSDALKAISSFYLFAGIWLAVLVGTSLAMLGPLGAVYSALELSPTLRAALTLALAVSLATLAARLGWSRLRRARRPAEARQARRGLRDGGSAAALVAPRPGIRL